MFDLFRIKEKLRKEWNEKGAAYAQGINRMFAFAAEHGWDKWKEKKPEDERGQLVEKVLGLLREANKKGSIDAFRTDFPPAHSPFVPLLDKKGISLEHFCALSDSTLLFIRGTAYQPRQAFLVKGQTAHPLDESIIGIGQSSDRRIIAIATNQSIVTYRNWPDSPIATFDHPLALQLRLTQLLPFNDGRSLVLVSDAGIYLLTETNCRLIHPDSTTLEAGKKPHLNMEHAALSANNQWIALGDQNSDHLILDKDGNILAEVGPQSSYPHFAIFSKNNEQVILNSCHFYNGITIGVPTKDINGLKIKPFARDERYMVIDEICRVYVGLATANAYIVGDAYGYIKAFSPGGQHLWYYFLGSTISGMAISGDEQTLWVGTCAGILHKLQLGKGHRDDHVIGTGLHYEEFRMLFWKDEPQPLIW